MVKVLVANENIEQNRKYCQFLAKDKGLNVTSAANGTSALQKYLEINPNIFILDSYFTDICYTDIIDRICITLDEKKKCNTIVTVNNSKEQLLLQDTAKIYKILKKPLNLCTLSLTISSMITESQIIELKEIEVASLLLSLKFHIGSEGCRYLTSAIIHCYYFPNSIYSLIGVYKSVAKQHEVPIETVKEAIRSALLPINRYGIETDDNILKLLDNKRNITPKFFLEVVTTYFRRIKQK